MVSPADAEPTPEWQAIIGTARDKIAAKKARLEDEGFITPGAEASFHDRYTHLLEEITHLLEEVPEVEMDLHDPGARIRFSPTDREVRITPLEEQRLIHLVFGHATLGTLHRAEHHASRPFGDRPPNVALLLRQILNFLIEGVEPGWLTRRGKHPHPPEAEGGTLELPLE
jgi:hypothetical protein